MTQAFLKLDGVRLEYAGLDGSGFLAVSDVTLDIHQGEFITVVGPSGCGKSSLLLMIGGLIHPTAGTITLDGELIRSPGPNRAIVFQEAGLLPWRSVLANVELGLELQRVPKAERRAVAQQLIQRVGLEGFEQYRPYQLSGGMRQRVGIARALALDPAVLLMDEPFGALDAQTRQVMAADLLEVWERDRKTILFVTHDIDEAVYLADRVVVMSASPGRVLEVLNIDLPRPRTMEMRGLDTFASYRLRIWNLLESEVRKTLGRELAGARR